MIYFELLGKINSKRSYILNCGGYKRCNNWREVADYITYLSNHRFLGWESIKVKRCNKNRYKIRLKSKSQSKIKQVYILF